MTPQNGADCTPIHAKIAFWRGEEPANKSYDEERQRLVCILECTLCKRQNPKRRPRRDRKWPISCNGEPVKLG